MELFSHSQHPFSMRCFELALLVVLTHLSSLASAACNNSVRVFNGDTEVTDEICKKEYLTQECLGFTTSHNLSFLPKDEMRGHSVQGPGQLDVLAITTSHNGKSNIEHYPALRFTWKSPTSETARLSIKGFYIWIKSDDGEQTDCRIFSVDHSKYTYDQLRFEYDLEKISEARGRNYTVRVYSLPMPDRQSVINNWLSNRENYKAKLVTTKNPFTTDLSVVQYPAYWTAGITVEPSLGDRSIDVWFSTPDPSLNYGFSSYTLGLVDIVTDSYNPIPGGEVNIKVDPTSNATSAHYKFTDLRSDTWYQVYVSVKDQYRLDDDNCQCYYKEDTGSFFGLVKHCESSCPISRSAIFDLKGDVTSDPQGATHAPPITTDGITSSETKPPTSTSSNQTLTPDDDDYDGLDQNIVVPLSIGGAVIIILVASVFAFLQCQRKQNEGLLKSKMKASGTDGPVGLVSYIERCPSLKRKTVFLLYSTDHEYHREMMKQFKIFLQTHCKCNVEDTSEFDANLHGGMAALWLYNKFSNCDLIIFVDSPGAHIRLVENTKKQEYYAKESGPHGDLFNLGLHYMCSEIIEKRLTDRAMIVSLTEERCKEIFLGVLKEWVLPRDLSFFLQQLHGFKSTSMDTYKSQLPMMHEFEQELPHVPDLLRSIKDVTTFEKQNPDWFYNHFELIVKAVKPVIERIVSSDDSTYGSMNGSENRSVTPPLSSSTNPSPFSDDLQLPRFPKNDDIDEGSYSICTEFDCITLMTDHPRFSDTYAGNGDNLTPSTFVNGSDERNGQRDDGHKTVPEKRALVPPPDMSEINPESTSVAIGGFNHKMSQLDGGGSLHTSKEIVPPCNKSQIVVDNLSMAIGSQNQGLNRSSSGDRTARDDIKPPVKLSDLQFDNYSLALEESNQKNGIEPVDGASAKRYQQFRPTKNSNGNQKVLCPPRDDSHLSFNSDGFSEILSSNNSDFTNNNDKNNFLASKGKMTNRNNTNHGHRDNQRKNTIHPPVDTIPVEKLDNFSDVLNTDINRNNFSHTVPEDQKEELQEHGKQFQNPIYPPVSDVSSENMDSISWALQNMNTKSKDSFMSSKRDTDIYIV